MINFEFMSAILSCPCCQSSTLSVVDANSEIVCKSCGSQYPISSGRPILLQPDNVLFCQDDYHNIKLPALPQSRRSWQSFIPQPLSQSCKSAGAFQSPGVA